MGSDFHTINLKDAGRIKCVGSKRTGKWEIKKWEKQ